MSAFDDAFNEVSGQQPAPAALPMATAQPVVAKSAFDSAFDSVEEDRQAGLAPRAERRRALEEQYAAEDRERTAMEGNWLDDMIIGIGSGMTDVGQGVGNMLGFVDDETIAEKKRIDASGGLDDSTAGGVGEFVGEMAALAPLGAVGGGARVLGAASKLPTAMKILGATTEGALGGAILADPNEREGGAILGGGFGGALSTTGSVLSRTLKGGLVKKTKAAEQAVDYIKDKTGKRPMLPLSIGGDAAADATSSTTKGIADIGLHIPSAKGQIDDQIENVSTKFYEADLRKAFAFNKGVADKAVKVLKETGDMQKAIESGLNKRGLLPSTEARILDAAARKAPKGRYTGHHLLKASEDAAGDAPLTNAPFRDLANQRIELLPSGDKTRAGESTVLSRGLAHQLFGNLMGISGIGKVVGSETFQNFVMGNNWAQRQLQDAMATKSGDTIRRVVGTIRTAMAANSPDAPMGVGEAAQNQVQALRGN